MTLEVCCIATKRSGHHAFIEWVLKGREGRHGYLNNISPGKPSLPSKVMVSNLESLTPENFASTKLETRIISYENHSLNEVLSDPFSSRESRVGGSDRRVVVLLLRDPVNALASVARIVEETSYDPATLGRLARAWKSHAKEYLGKTTLLNAHYRPGDILHVSYNLFLRSEDYCQNLSRRLEMIDVRRPAELSRLAKGGNTWFADSEHYVPTADVLESRWQQLRSLEPIAELFRSDDELRSLAVEFYGAIGLREKFQPVVKSLSRRPSRYISSLQAVFARRASTKRTG